MDADVERRPMWAVRSRGVSFFKSRDFRAAVRMARKVWRYQQMFKLTFGKPHIYVIR